jgi:hypothetical protein
MYLQSQLEGLESIFFELIPYGVELKRNQVQDYYDRRFDQAVKPNPPVAETELRRQFNTKANQVRNLVDSAESLGEAGNRLNLIRAAACLPEERSRSLSQMVTEFCRKLLNENKVDRAEYQEIINSEELTPSEARVLLGASMFIIVDELETSDGIIPTADVLGQFINKFMSSKLLENQDPFMIEAKCALEAMKEDA